MKRAATLLFVGQSAVSMALARLRALFDDELFVKVAAGVAPTSKAIAIEPQVREVLELVHRTVYEQTEFEPRTARRTIRVGMSDDVELWLLPRLLDRMQAIAPGITLIVRPSNFYSGLGLLERDEADVVVGILPPPSDVLVAELLFEERLIARPSDALVSRRASRSRALAHLHWLSMHDWPWSGQVPGPVHCGFASVDERQTPSVAQ